MTFSLIIVPLFRIATAAVTIDDFCRGGERGHHVIRETRPSQELDGAGGDQIVDPEDRRPTFTDADPGRSNFRPVLEVDRGQIENHQERRDQETYHGHGSRRLGRLHARRAIAHDQDVLLRRSRGLRRHRQAVRDDAKDQVRFGHGRTGLDNAGGGGGRANGRTDDEPRRGHRRGRRRRRRRRCRTRGRPVRGVARVVRGGRRRGDGAGARVRRRPASRVGGRAVRGRPAAVQRARGVPARAAPPVLLAGGAVHGARARPVPPGRAPLAGRVRRAAVGPLAPPLVSRAGRRLTRHPSRRVRHVRLVRLVRRAQAKEEDGPRRGRLAHVRRRSGRSAAQQQRVPARHIAVARVHVAVSRRAVRPQNDTPRDRIIYRNVFG